MAGNACRMATIYGRHALRGTCFPPRQVFIGALRHRLRWPHQTQLARKLTQTKNQTIPIIVAAAWSLARAAMHGLPAPAFRGHRGYRRRRTFLAVYCH